MVRLGRIGPAFEIMSETDEYVLLNDLAMHEATKSITNGAEEVVDYLLLDDKNKTKKFYYMDSDGRVDELEHDGDKFTLFKLRYDNLTKFNEDKLYGQD